MSVYIPSMPYNMPVKWRRIFSENILDVTNVLNIDAEGTNWADNCIFVYIKKSGITNIFSLNMTLGIYSEWSIKNLNINGYDYYPDLIEFSLRIEIGYRNCGYNKKLFPKLLRLENNKAPLALSNFCNGCTFDRKIRLNKMQANVYKSVKIYNSLIDYLSDIMSSGIYYGSMTDTQCIAKLQSLGLKNYDGTPYSGSDLHHRNYNWLEYLGIVMPPINCKKFLAEDPATIKKFKEQIEFLFKLMILIDYIQNH